MRSPALRDFLLCTMAVAVGLFPFAGCGRPEEPAPPEDTVQTRIETEEGVVDIQVGTDGDRVGVSAETEEGAFTLEAGGQVQLPQNFPGDVPLYPGMEILVAQALEQRETFTLQGRVDATSGEVSSYYREAAPAEGWEEKHALAQPTGEIITFEQGERMLNILVAAEDEGVFVTLHTGRE